MVRVAGPPEPVNPATYIGIDAEWDEENSRALVEVLIEEINDQTDFRLSAVPWQECGKVHTRILVKKEESGLENLIRIIQTFGLTRNKLLSGDEVRAAINSLVDAG